jgi:Zn-dependent protease with chaperone function
MRGWQSTRVPVRAAQVVGALVVLWCGQAAAAPKRDAAEEAAFERPLAAVDPALASAFRAATAAYDADRFDEADAGFRRVLEKAPDHGPTLRRLAWVSSLRKQPDEALRLARRAQEVAPGPESKGTLALVMSASGDPALKPQSRALADEAFREKPEERTATLRAQFALEDNDMASLPAAVADLRRLAPESAGTHYYGAILHLIRNEAEQASQALDRAVAAGFPAEVAADLREKTGLGRQLRIWLYVKLAGLAFVAWLAGLLLLYLFGRWLSARTLAAIDRSAGDAEQLKRGTQGLRGIYRRTIAVAAAYYYLSIPFVIALVLVGAGAVVLGFLLIGWLPIYLLAGVVIGALFSVWAVLRSLLAARAPQEDPGRKLSEADAPALWATLREVAAKVGTRPVDVVFVTPGAEVAVTETGPLRDRLADRGRRMLILGIGGLSDFSLPAFKAVLAHEYGHFSHRDTAGGGMAMAVLAALLRTVLALAQRGGLLILNPAWHFLRVFNALFMRITLGASRLQEVLADHFAAVAYGPRAFTAGLSHVVKRSVEFERATKYLVERAERHRQPVTNLYFLPPDADLSAEDGTRAVSEAMQAKGSPYDSHPPPSQRLAWIARLPAVPSEELEGQPDAWSLFPSRDALEGEMTRKLNDELETAGVIDPEPIAPFVPPVAAAGD